ncbi:DEAD/DEAH box helicase [Flavobacterium sediminilitoris]|uniref:DEAD/DEAH box helicase n=1 Tax=Flavobacterium sediminilitoris TaxID=2024526 RepID=A0ABY4HIQ9_9FLAO|nr:MULTISPECIES: DEAD/DEAH box helicase [Flavobacterium]UOX32252.1 DEAD/DEAH box helicase [Flavobacterium sediminilitoris]
MSNQFSKLGITAPILKSLADLEIATPTEIQEKTIPILLNKADDFVGLAKTGTGKTAAFGLPLLQLIKSDNQNIQVVILVPTRELGHQIFSNMETFAKYLPEVSIAATCGGIPIKPQIERLSKPTHIVIATPGRLIDLIKRNAINIKEAKYLVLDEADEMITALKDGLDEIIVALPKSRRTLLFSATMPGTIKQLIQNYMSKHVTQVSADMKTVGNNSIDHQYLVVDPIEKLNILMHFLTSREGQRGIIFCKTKAAVNKLAKNLAINRFSSGALHGSLTQPIRDRIMEQFREGHINILVATDLAARGIDVKEVSYVVNYHLPDVYEAYVHRSGRTARAGANGLSLTILQKEEIIELADFQKELGITFTEFKKPDNQSIEDNNVFLWAKQIFKTKPNNEISPVLKDKIKTVFHHLTKDELIEKMLANHLLQNKNEVLIKAKTPVKKKK